MFAVDVCRLPETGGSIFVVVAGLFLLIAGLIVTRWVRASAGRMSVVVAPLVLLGGLVLAPSVIDPCAPATTTTPVATTTITTPVATTTTTPATTTTTIVAASTTTIALTCAMGGSCAVGDPGPGGGIVFYVDLTRQPGAQYFEAACAGWQNNCDGTTADPGAEWGCSGTVISGADGLLIGTGELNTADIVFGCATDDIAAKVATELVLGGQTDWYLPSLDELNALCKWAYGDSLNTVCNINGSGTLTLTYGGFVPGSYWSSSEFSASIAWSQFFRFGGQSDSDKDSVRYVRPVRAF